MKRLARISAVLATFLCSVPCFLGAKVEEGLLFRSYEVVPDRRTSLDIPAAGEHLTFKDSLRVSFDLRFELDRGRFGYVCRLYLDDNTSLDLLLSTPRDGNTFLGATGDHRNMFTLLSSDASLEQWHPVHVELVSRDGRLRALVNGQEIYQETSVLPRHSVSLSFGRGDAGKNVTSDVAPMVVKNLRIRQDCRKPQVWPMAGDAEFKRGASLSAQISNPVWLQDNNREWRQVWQAAMPSVTYICPDTLRRCVWLVSEGQVIRYDIASRRARSFQPGQKMRLGLAVNDFVVLEGGTLAYADGETLPALIRFNAQSGEWEKDNPREHSTPYLHHNSLYLGPEQGYVYLFGYGHYRYQKQARLWKPGSKASVLDLPGVFPRYLSAAGCKDGMVYVLGGKGNEVGIQELGTRLYNDFFSINLQDGTVSRLWKSEVMEKEVAAQDLLFSPDGGSFLALTYDPEVYESALQLRRFLVADGSSSALGLPISYPFLDIDAEARLVYDPTGEHYVSILTYKDKNGVYQAAVYELGSPVLDILQAQPAKPVSPWWLLLLVVPVGGALPLLLRKNGAGKRPASAGPITGTKPDGPAVSLLGGFRVCDARGEDITSSFSPQTARFFAILILHTAEYGGISNAKLKALLWSDKSDESYNNNRGVTMKKIRTVLEQVGPIDFVSDGGQWKVTDPEGLCDYLLATRILQQQPGLEQVLNIAAEGPLLPEVQQDYLDPFKSLHANRVLQLLEAFREQHALPAEMSIRVADAQLLFDSLDEEAIRAKCQALIAQKKLGSAQAVFSRFTDEYLHVMGEPFGADFKNFVKK